jgi:hypothetical protein
MDPDDEISKEAKETQAIADRLRQWLDVTPEAAAAGSAIPDAKPDKDVWGTLLDLDFDVPPDPLFPDGDWSRRGSTADSHYADARPGFPAQSSTKTKATR